MAESNVQVACKRPNGLILELVDNSGQIQKVTLNGAAKSSLFRSEMGMMSGLYGVTSVPADFWQAWSKQNKDYPPLKYGEVFAQNSENALNKQAKEQEKQLTGLEGVDSKTTSVKTLDAEKRP